MPTSKSVRNSYQVAENDQEIQQNSIQLIKIEKQIGKAEAKLGKLNDKKIHYRSEIALLTNEKNLSAIQKNKLSRIRIQLKMVIADEKEVAAYTRELKKSKKDQKKLLIALQQKEKERKKALNKFLTKWENDYDKKTKILELRVAARRKIPT